MPSRRNTLLTLAAASLSWRSGAATERAEPPPIPSENSRATSAAATPRSSAPLRLLTTEYAPYMSSTSGDGGAALAIGRAALERAGIAAEVLFRPWARVIAETERGESDGILGVWFEPSRERYLAYTQALGVSNRIGFMARAGNAIVVDDLSRLSQIAGLRIGTVRGYANPPRFEQIGFTTDLAIDDATNLRKLLAGRIDLVLIDKGVAFHLLQTQLREAAPRFQWLEPAVADMPLHMALTRNRPDFSALLGKVNRGLSELRDSGELAMILKRSAYWI
ncbi:transporter substrate-binding domain-containing protein [Paucibacter sp. AS339]|uniref:substrate-binding periplasmic protein n=1 Tax=Paucibacter hankyongi TaxID=3133434 RepID=UPI0030AB89DD